MEDIKKYRYALMFEFLGTSFAGSQIQPKQITVQSEIEKALKILLRTSVKTVFAGRTDSGVHASCQYLHFDSVEKIEAEKFLLSMNAIISDDISIKKIIWVDKAFHAQKSARYRWYRYLINNKQTRSVLLKNTSKHYRGTLNIDEMQKALNFITGIHDFTSFKKTNTNNPAKECNLIYARCRNFSGIIYIDLIANRFLYNMVRIIVGTLLEIGKGNQPAEYILDVINAKNRQQAGSTADPHGLTLVGVGYDEKYNLNEIKNTETTNEQNILCKT